MLHSRKSKDTQKSDTILGRLSSTKTHHELSLPTVTVLILHSCIVGSEHQRCCGFRTLPQAFTNFDSIELKKLKFEKMTQQTHQSQAVTHSFTAAVV